MTDKNADSNYYLNEFCCKRWDIYNKHLESVEFDRFRVLCPEGKNEGEREKREEKERRDFQEKIEKLLSEYCGHFFEYTKENGIWVIINYYSLFLESRLNALKNSSDNDVCKKDKSDISWYKLFGSLNEDTVILLTKVDSRNALDKINILHIPASCHEGFPATKDELTLNDDTSNAIKKFQSQVCNLIKKISRKSEFVIGNEKFTEIDTQKIATTLFKKYKMDHWEECLIFSNKYNEIEFGGTLEYFPNILFFKEKGEFIEADIRLCKGLNKFYVKLVSRLLIFENEILLDRLDDLVATKTQRLFKNFKEETSKEEYKQSVKDLMHSFFNEYVNGIHPIFEK
ncbi:hypothetical protein KJ980_08955, partial [Patescibacteria group bacterium]|nr:hypothetical protein [Patescibacteria group bacterium]